MDDFVLSAFPIGMCEYHFNWENVRFSLYLDSGLFQSEDSHQFTNEEMHRHPHYEWFFVTNGAMRLETENEAYLLRRNDFVVIPPELSHRVKFTEENTTRYNLNFSFCGNGFSQGDHLLDQLQKLFGRGRCVTGTGNKELADINKRISQMCGTNRRAMICTCFMEMLWSIFDILDEKPSQEPVEKLLCAPDISRSEKIRQIFCSYYMYDLSLEHVAGRLGLSTRQLNRVIRKEYNCTYHERLSYMRICSARQLLLKTDFTIGEIAQWVGYSSLCGFYTAFKSQYGCLPTEYRKKQKRSREE